MNPITISGFSFVRNARKFDFPLVESLRSLLPLCDELVVAVGAGEDDTLEMVQGIGDDRIRIVETVWDDSLREGGRVLAQQTNIALAECRGDWCIYLQADEVIHEEDHQLLRQMIQQAHNDPNVEALLMRYVHFYGTYDYVGAGRQWYRREIRAVRNTRAVTSWGDAQGFRKLLPSGQDALLKARQTEVRIFHYGWVRPPKVQASKQRDSSRMWHDDKWVEQNVTQAEQYGYDGAFELRPFAGTHPAFMQERIAAHRQMGWAFDPTRTRPRPLRVRLTDWIERHTGWRIGEYRNFVEV
ncbi:MAG: glycosyltransferase [Chlorobi bacterium]|nr:MAG: Glycosyl transferase family 2 [Chlorobi bacterium OLB7]MBK8909857.1 glycosyltransferase [Chlorobiota bacterium]MBX7215609.1 glycosyltransferase [Candidatus Kapabacteria bacterium]